MIKTILKLAGKYSPLIIRFAILVLIGGFCIICPYDSKGRSSNLSTIKSDTLVLEGKYNGKNVHLLGAMDGHCSYHKYFVNGKLPKGLEKYGTAFEVRLDSCNLTIGDKVKIEILYEKGQEPKTLNPEVLK